MEKRNGESRRKGLWTMEEDRILMDYIRMHGKGKWNQIAKATDLKRCGKSCRLRWLNYLSPGVKRGDFSEEENDLIIRLHKLLGNRWSLIAGRVPGRTDNQVKNHWNTHLSKKLGMTIRKGKCKVAAQPSNFLAEDLNQNHSITHVPLSTCIDRIKGASEEEKTIEEESARDAKELHSFPGFMDKGHDKPFWFSIDHLLHSYNAIGHLDEFSIDLAWSGLM